MSFQSAIEQLWTAGTMKNSLPELDPLHSSTLPLWQHLTLCRAWEGDGDSGFPASVGQLPSPWLPHPSPGSACWGDGGWGAPGRHITRIYCLSWGPSLASGNPLVNAAGNIGIVTPRTKICSRPMGKVIYSWTSQKVSNRDTGLDRHCKYNPAPV